MNLIIDEDPEAPEVKLVKLVPVARQVVPPFNSDLKQFNTKQKQFSKTCNYKPYVHRHRFGSVCMHVRRDEVDDGEEVSDQEDDKLQLEEDP